MYTKTYKTLLKEMKGDTIKQQQQQQNKKQCLGMG